ncbi:MAG TPA: carboxypeptidase regulatory-like domain-containing protein [Candidatus Acidoferrales bacterium]|nr:carboxypeptidase regulatory-like domain-containing protein [Candidatus Acidoferrales bacterium]
MRKLIRVWTALTMVLLFAGIALAQDTGRLNGEIFDKDGKPYPGVSVEIKSVDTGQTFNLKTDKDGKFVQLGLRVGIYTILLVNENDKLHYGPIRFAVDPTKENNFRMSVKEQMAAAAAAHPEEIKKRAEEEDKFKAMKGHFDAGIAAMAEANDLQKQIKAAPADQKPPLQEKRAADCQKAVTEFTQAEQGVGAKEVANHATVWQDIGAADECIGHYDEAADAFQKAVDLKPQAAYYAGLSTNLANSAAAQTDPKVAESKLADANADCEKALALEPAAGGTCYKNVGIVLNNKGRSKDSVVPLQKATQANPQDAQAWFLLGGALSAGIEPKQEGEKMMYIIPPGTKEAYQKCIDLAPNTPLAAQAKEALDGLDALSGGADTTVSKKKKKS